MGGQISRLKNIQDVGFLVRDLMCCHHSHDLGWSRTLCQACLDHLGRDQHRRRQSIRVVKRDHRGVMLCRPAR